MSETRKLLPGPAAHHWEWRARGACRGLDTGLFYPSERERGPVRAELISAAKRICHSCPVLDECRRHALVVREPYGVWGGMSVAERADVIRGRGATDGSHSVASERQQTTIVSEVLRAAGDGRFGSDGREPGGPDHGGGSRVRGL
jgi:WhiB family redox-sensing transcriptional regulator